MDVEQCETILLTGEKEMFLAVKVTRQCPLVLLVKVR
jgi:hypothetical protein